MVAVVAVLAVLVVALGPDQTPVMKV